MKKKHIVLILLFCLPFCDICAQNIEELADTVLSADEVLVTKQKRTEKVSVGSKITEIEQTIIDQNQTKTLSELLNDNSVINIKSLGQGAMATASFRGTSSNHTQVLWNGIPLNSTTLGSFDFSQIPVYFTDNVSLYHGSSAQQSGSGALGGSVNFSSNDNAVSKPYVSILGEYGSNNTIVGAGTLRLTKNRLTSSTRLYYQQSDNDYRYLNKVYSKDEFYENRENAAYTQTGAMQEFYYKTKKNDKLSVIAWGQLDDRELPQSIISSATATENTTTINLRTLASYEAVREQHRFKLTLANLWNDFDYDKNFGTYVTYSNNKGNSLVFRGDYGLNVNNKIEIGGTLKYRNDRAISSSLEDSTVTRNTFSLRAFALFKPLKRLHFDVDATFETLENNTYGVYNVSARYMAIAGLLTLKASNAYNYRVPTLNDLYWNPGGNPDLSPEKGFSSDVSVIYTPKIGNLDIELEALYYYMDIKDWIMWIPTENGYIWSPENFSDVISKGVEFNMKLKLENGDFKHSLIGNYTYAHSVDNSNRGDDAQGKQLAYIPRNKGNVRYEIWWKNQIWANYTVSYTGERYTSADEEYSTNAYTLNNVEIGGIVNLKDEKSLKLSLKIDNLFNSYYESTQYYPMPLRMYRLQVNYCF
ncbi:MAG: TonB-dependent receptor [Rikenellaceae bacterium]